MTINVLIVDDHDLFRIGLKATLYPYEDIIIIGEAADGLEAIQCCDSLSPDVVLMDMPRMSGLEAIPVILQHCPATQILILATFSNKPLIHGAIQAGALGYLLKNILADELVNAIRDTAQGRTTITYEVAQVLVETVRLPPTSYSLTRRQKEVLICIIKGMTNDAIAVKMVIAPATAKKHVGNILAKLNARTRAEAVTIALKENLIEI